MGDCVIFVISVEVSVRDNKHEGKIDEQYKY